MTKENQQLWERISLFDPDDPGADFRFSHRLAQENGWNILYARRVIEEYKKFIFLCCTAPTAMTPSDAVDQAWHLHLCYTKSYWEDLCQNTLGRALHHNPTKGGLLEAKKFNDCYRQTLHEYQQAFHAAPPSEIWPDINKRFKGPEFKRISTATHFILDKQKTLKLGLISLAVLAAACLIGWLLIKEMLGFTETALGGLALAIVVVALKSEFDGRNQSGRNSSGCSAGTGCGGDAGHGCGSGCSGGSGCGGGCSS